MHNKMPRKQIHAFLIIMFMLVALFGGIWWTDTLLTLRLEQTRVKTVAVVICALLTVSLLCGIALMSDGTASSMNGASNVAILDKFDMFLTKYIFGVLSFCGSRTATTSTSTATATSAASATALCNHFTGCLVNHSAARGFIRSQVGRLIKNHAFESCF